MTASTATAAMSPLLVLGTGAVARRGWDWRWESGNPGKATSWMTVLSHPQALPTTGPRKQCLAVQREFYQGVKSCRYCALGRMPHGTFRGRLGYVVFRMCSA